MLVIGRLKVLAQLVGSEKQLRFETEIATVAVGLSCLSDLCARLIAG
jgi:hypothetical protein